MDPARTNRRTLLVASAGLALSTAFKWRARARASADEIETLVHWIRVTPREPAVQRGARELRAGLDPGTLLGALLVAAARAIRTDRANFNHAALVVSALDQFSADAPMSERQRMALWCLDNFKEAQEEQARSDDWHVAPIDGKKLPAGAQARAALVAALEAWDREAADVALVGWLRSAPLDEVYALVWEYGPRCVANLGHKAIYAALARRALPLAGERFAADVLRSVVSSFFLHGRTESAAAFEASRELVTRGISARVARPASDRGPARELLATLRRSTPAEMPLAVAELLRAGARPDSLWEAIVIAACEVTVADPGVAALHAFTSMNALHHIACAAPSERVALLALLQATAWLAQFRSSLTTTAAAFRVDAIEPTTAKLDAVFAAALPRGLESARGAQWLGQHEPAAFLERARALARTKSDDVHEFKLAAAALDEARVAGPWALPCVCAVLAVHVPGPTRTDSARLQRLGTALAAAAH